MSVDSLLEFAAEAVPSVVETASEALDFGSQFLSGLDISDAFQGFDIASNAGAVADQVGSFAGSGSFWESFNPGNLLEQAQAGISDFFNPNAGIALTEQFAGQTPGFSVGGLLGDAFTNVSDFFSQNTGIDLTQQILSTNNVAGVLNDPYSLTSLAQQGQDLIAAAGSSANPLSDLLAKATGLVDRTFTLGNVLKVAQAVGPQAVNALFGGGQTGQLAAQVFRTGVSAVSGAVNPQVTVLGPNAGPQLPTSQGTTVYDNSYGGGSAAEYNALNYSIAQQQIQDADAGVALAQENVASQERTLAGATESYNQASASVEAYDRLLAESGLSEQEIADLTAQREAAVAQQAEAQYQIGVAQQDLAQASDQLLNANNQYDSAVASANAINISPAQDPVNTQPAPVSIQGVATPNAVNAVISALGGPNQLRQLANQLLPGAVNANAAGLPTAATAAAIGNIVRNATGVDINTDQGLALLQAVAAEVGLTPDQVAALARTTQGGIDQALLDQARNVATLRQQTQNPAQSGDWRVRLRLAPQSNYLYNAPNPGILQPLKLTDGVIFPYTPRIDTTYRADYENYNLTHSNYRGLFYKSSYVDGININGVFTAQDTQEANYLLAVIHFFRSATKMFYGQDALRGAPPPLVFLTGLGEYQFSEHPCVITSFQYNLPDNVDYVRAYSAFPNGTNLLSQRARFQGTASNPLSYALQRLASVGLTKGALDDRIPPPTLGVNNPNYVPTRIDIQLTLLPVQSRSQVSQQFSLQNFANGNLLKGGFW